MHPSPHLWFMHAKQRLLDLNRSLYGYQTSPVILCIDNSVISTRNTCLCGPQTSSVVLCMQNSDFRTRLASLYGSQTSSVVLSLHISVLSTRTKRLYWFQPSPVFFTSKRAGLASELLVSMGPSPHLWLLDAKQRLLDQNNKSLLVPDITYRFGHAKPRD